MAIDFSGGVISFLIVAVVIGLVNALIVPAVKGLFKKNGTLLVFILSLIIDAAALWVVGFFSFFNFSIEFFPTAIIAAVVLTIINTGFSVSNK